MKITETHIDANEAARRHIEGQAMLKTWIVVADSGTVRILHRGENSNLETVAEARADEDGFINHAQKTGGLAGGRRIHFASDPRDRGNHHKKRSFAKDIAEWLEAALQQRSYDRLVIAAPPRMLGDIRAALHDAVAERVSAEVAKDLVSRPVGEIAGYL